MTMKKISRWMCLGLAGVLSLCLSAQTPSIPDLKADEAIVKGQLENGIRYALWPDASFKNCFTISLVQKDSLRFLEKFNSARKSFAVDSVLYRAFTLTRDAIIAHPEQVGCDNTMLFVTGDFNKEDLLARMQHLSVVLPRHTSEWERAERPVWEEQAPTLRVQETEDGHALLTYTLCRPAMDEKFNATIIPTIVERSWTMFGRILERRLECALEASDIPYGGISTRFRMAEGLENHHRFTLRAVVEKKDVPAATVRICRVLEDLRSGQVSESEVEAASRAFLFERFGKDIRPVSPSAQARRLFRSYLYNDDLASEKTKTYFFTSRKYKASDDKKRFDRFAAQAIRIPACCTTADGEIRFSLDSVPVQQGPVLHFSDTTAFPGKTKACKITRIITEGTTGGTMFFFDNETRVIYKQKACGKRVYFTFVFDGGISQLGNPEGAAWTEDVFYAGRVNGYRMKDYISLLAAGGIDLHFTASFSALTLEGSCEERKVSSLLKALIALTRHWKVEENDWAYITRCAQIPSYKDDYQQARRQVSRKLHPNYAWDMDKSNVRATIASLREVAGLIRGSFRSTQNATLFLQGEIAERRVQSKLKRFMEQFPVDGRSVNSHLATMLTVSGTTIVGDVAPEKPMLIASSFNYSVGLDQQLVKEIALSMVQDRLRTNLAPMKIRCRVEEHIIYQPVENVELFIRLSGSGMEALHIVNETLREMANGKVPEAAFRRAVADILARSQAQEVSPFYWRDIVFNRFAYGKDYHNRVKDRLGKITREEVSRFCGQWARAGRVEYVMK